MIDVSRRKANDAETEAFVKANVVSFVAWDLLICFNRYPEATESLRGLAAMLGREERDMLAATHVLVENGVLQKSDDPGEARFGLSTDPGMREMVSRFVRMTEDRDLRLEVVRRVLANVSL